MEILEIKPDAIPGSAFCHCPAKRFALVRIRDACVPCPHFAGFVEFGRPAEEFENRMRPLCAHPIARAIVTVNTGD